MKGQVSIELLGLAGVMFVFLLFFNNWTFDLQARTREKSLYFDAKRVCNLLSNEINTAASVGDGYKSNFILPYSLVEDTPYAPSIFPGSKSVIINWNGRDLWCPIITSNVTSILIVNGPNTIRNSKGGIIIG